MLLESHYFEGHDLESQHDVMPGQVSAQDDILSDCMPLDRSTVLMLSILELLHTEHAQGRTQVSLAVICKRLEIRMSTLQRLMTALSEQALVQVLTQKDRLVASLTPGGEEISLALLAA